MPTFVIHAMGRPAQKATINKPEIVAGRDIKCDLILPAAAVSHQHAVFSADDSGRWGVRCLSETNPIVVNGAVIKESAQVTEGTEILIGTEFLLVFVENEFKADNYMGGKSIFGKYQCMKCDWSGMLSSLNREKRCMSCGGMDLKSLERYSAEIAMQDFQEGSTCAIDPDTVKASLNKLKNARRSRFERIDGRTEGTVRKNLSESEAVVVGRKPGATFMLFGFSWGDGARVVWEGKQYVIKNELLFPAMKVNGTKTRTAPLRDGDVIELGRNRFRFITE